MKDFFDLWAISDRIALDGAVLAAAIAATFKRRATPLPETTPIALTAEFAEVPGKQSQWAAFLRRTATDLAPLPLAKLLAKVELFIMAPTLSLVTGKRFGGLAGLGQAPRDGNDEPPLERDDPYRKTFEAAQS